MSTSRELDLSEEETVVVSAIEDLVSGTVELRPPEPATGSTWYNARVAWRHSHGELRAAMGPTRLDALQNLLRRILSGDGPSGIILLGTTGTYRHTPWTTEGLLERIPDMKAYLAAKALGSKS